MCYDKQEIIKEIHRITTYILNFSKYPTRNNKDKIVDIKFSNLLTSSKLEDRIFISKSNTNICFGYYDNHICNYFYNGTLIMTYVEDNSNLSILGKNSEVIIQINKDKVNTNNKTLNQVYKDLNNLIDIIKKDIILINTNK